MPQGGDTAVRCELIDDAAILTAVDGQACGGGANTRAIGIRNEAGDIRRVGEAEGLAQFMELIATPSYKPR